MGGESSAGLVAITKPNYSKFQSLLKMMTMMKLRMSGIAYNFSYKVSPVEEIVWNNYA